MLQGRNLQSLIATLVVKIVSFNLLFRLWSKQWLLLFLFWLKCLPSSLVWHCPLCIFQITLTYCGGFFFFFHWSCLISITGSRCHWRLTDLPHLLWNYLLCYGPWTPICASRKRALFQYLDKTELLNKNSEPWLTVTVFLLFFLKIILEWILLTQTAVSAIEVKFWRKQSNSGLPRLWRVLLIWPTLFLHAVTNCHA